MSGGLDVPAWCRIRRGRGALLLVAPHGGARASARGDRAVKVNDLHTAELATELADALDAGLIANPVLDRNELDLNRISQVARRAPWFPALLETLVGEILARHERAEVVFLHGWNTVQPKCDIGIGQTLREPADAATHAAALTASAAYVSGRLAALRAACADAGIAAPLGERYPARHANNVLQLFRRTGDGGVAPRLRDWAAAGRIEAVQLELAAPLRWPGPLRGAFAAALRDAFTGAATATGAGPATAVGRSAPDVAPSAMALQVYDAAAGIGLLARVDPAADGVSGRLLLFLGATEVALFTGDDRDCTRLSAGGPHFTPEPDGLRLGFDGWALCASDGALYVDLEQAFAASRLLRVDVDVTFTRRCGDHGRVRGTVTLDGVPHPIDAAGFAPPSGIITPADTGWRSHLTLRAALPGDAAIALRQRVPGAAVLQIYGDDRAPHPVRALAVTFDGEPYTPRRIVVADRGATLVAETLARMAILRPLPGGRRMRVTFGIAGVERGGERGFGFYEYARVVD